MSQIIREYAFLLKAELATHPTRGRKYYEKVKHGLINCKIAYYNHDLIESMIQDHVYDLVENIIIGVEKNHPDWIVGEPLNQIVGQNPDDRLSEGLLNEIQNETI